MPLTNDEAYFYERGISDGLVDDFPHARTNQAYMKGYAEGQYIRHNNLELTRVEAVDILTEYSTMASFDNQRNKHESVSST